MMRAKSNPLTDYKIWTADKSVYTYEHVIDNNETKEVLKDIVRSMCSIFGEPEQLVFEPFVEDKLLTRVNKDSSHRVFSLFVTIQKHNSVLYNIEDDTGDNGGLLNFRYLMDIDPPVDNPYSHFECVSCGSGKTTRVSNAPGVKTLLRQLEPTLELTALVSQPGVGSQLWSVEYTGKVESGFIGKVYVGSGYSGVEPLTTQEKENEQERTE